MISPRRPLLLCVVLLVALLVPTGSAGAQESLVVQRLAGPTRFDTAVEVAKAWVADECGFYAALGIEPYGTEQECLGGIPVGLDLSRGDSFADALAIPTAAYHTHGPTFLTPPDQLWPGIDQLASHFSGGVIYGSLDVVGQQVADEIERRYGPANRLAGPDRYATSALAARFNAEISSATDSWDFVSGMLLVSGEDWPDALAVAALTSLGNPILLVRKNEIPAPAVDLIRQYGSQGTTFGIIGGEAVISQNVIDQLRTLTNGPIYRRAGPDRTATARAIADEYLQVTENSERDTNGIILIRPDSFADAIAAPSLIHSRQAPIIIPATVTDLGQANIDWLTANAGRLDTITTLGETDVVPDAIVQQAIDAICAARDCNR